MFHSKICNIYWYSILWSYDITCMVYKRYLWTGQPEKRPEGEMQPPCDRKIMADLRTGPQPTTNRAWGWCVILFTHTSGPVASLVPVRGIQLFQRNWGDVGLMELQKCDLLLVVFLLKQQKFILEQFWRLRSIRSSSQQIHFLVKPSSWLADGYLPTVCSHALMFFFFKANNIWVSGVGCIHS